MFKKPYFVRCLEPGCHELAKFKIASRWSDGIVKELKTYALTCSQCLPRAFANSKERNAGCKTMSGEILESPSIFELAPGKPSLQLIPRPDLETT